MLLAVCGLVLVLSLSGLRFADPLPLRVVRESTFDYYQRLAPREVPDVPVRVIDIDDASLAAYGQWPWPRDLLAKLTDRLAELGAAAIAYDILFAEPDRLSPSQQSQGGGSQPGTEIRDHDTIFARSIAQSPTVLGFKDSVTSSSPSARGKAGFAISGTDPTPSLPAMIGAVMPIAALAEAATGLGAFSLNATDSIEVVRRIPLVWSADGRLYPALSIEALRVAFGLQSIVVLGETNAPYMEGLRIGPVQVPTTPSGDLILYYRLPDPRLSISAASLLSEDYKEQALDIAGAIVLIGTSAGGLGDIRGTPLGLNVPGVTIHAQAIEQMLAQQFLTRADLTVALEHLSFVALGVFLVLVVLRAGPLFGLLTGAIAVAAAVLGSWFAFTMRGILFDPSFIALGGIAVYSAMIFLRFLTTDRDKRRIRRAFSHYVAPELLSEIERNADRLRLGGEVRELSVMFTDMRGFTAISEKVEPTGLVRLLNRLFGALGEEITRRSGTIDKFVGDAIMAFWNAPLDVPDHPLQACRAALAMRQKLFALNESAAFRADVPADLAELDIVMGIGISSGQALVGNLGLESRFDYSCIGDTVNLASRIESASKSVGYDILVAEATRAACSQLAFLEAGAIALKGKSRPAPIHILVGDEVLARDPAFLALEGAHQAVLRKLEQGRGIEAELEKCQEAAGLVQPQLSGFYAALALRRADFLSQPAAIAAD